MRADFDRVYSPPEPPSSRRMPRPRGWRVALACLLLGAGAVFFAAPMLLLEPDGELVAPPAATPTVSSEPSAEPSAGPSADPSTDPSADNSAEPPDASPSASEPSSPAASQGPPAGGSGILEALPKKVCDSVEESTFLKYVPKGRREEYGGSLAGSCGYTVPEDTPFRYVRLETRLGNIAGDPDPLNITKWSFDADYKRESQDEITRTLLLEKVTGLGEEAFQRVFVDEGSKKVTTARIEVRVHNVIITVAYSRAYAGKAEEQQEACLEGATEIAREAVKLYS